ncbi:MAG: ATP-binding protein [Candidatus Omnitrophota bacterium]
MIISVASGKGGTGKTIIATSLAMSLNGPLQLLDCDVEEPNAHIFIKPDITTAEDVYLPVPEVDETKCDFCGRCQKVCAYNAIAVIFPKDRSDPGKVLVFPELCHGCGSCTYFCPKDAIQETSRKIGIVEKGNKSNIEFIHGKLNIGEAISPPVIRAVKKRIDREKTVIIDAPPGTSCPVIASLQGTDYCILVTEPTPFGLYDLTLAVEVLRKMKIPFGVVVNRSDLGNNKTDEYCERKKIPVLIRIPFSREIAAAYSKGISIVEAFPEYRKLFQALFEDIKKTLKNITVKGAESCD